MGVVDEMGVADHENSSRAGGMTTGRSCRSRRRFPAGPPRLGSVLLLGLVLLVPSLAACGGGGSKAPTTTRTAPAATTSTSPATTAPATTAAPSQPGGKASVASGPVHGRLHAENHTPTVNKLWPYSVTVTDAAGHPLSGTVEIEFVFAGQVVGRDTPPTHPLKNGRWQDKLTFPLASVGQPLTFRAVVHTRLGSITLDWPISVHK